MKSLNREVRSEESTPPVFVHGRALPAVSPGCEGEELHLSRLQELLPDESDTRNDLKSSAVQREYTQAQELVVWALIIAIMVISVIVVLMLRAKANGTV
jgi:hypothetical protein